MPFSFLSIACLVKPPLAWLIQNGFTGEAFRLLVYFNPGLQNGFTLQCLDLRKIDETEAGISRAKEALKTNFTDIKR